MMPVTFSGDGWELCGGCAGSGLAGDGCRCHGGTACTTCGGSGQVAVPQVAQAVAA